MNLIQAILLGFIQGLTEFLPVSSSGHMEIGKAVFGINAAENFYFTIAAHGATVLSTIVVFRKEIARLLKGFFKFRLNEETLYVLKLIVSMIPVGLAGIFYRAEIEALFNTNMLLVGLMLLITASFLAVSHFIKKKERSITFLDALIIGIAQCFAVIPGLSRSGITISSGMMLGNRKDELARFSFLMVLVPVLGANFIEIISPDKIAGGTSIGVVLAGALAAFISGYIACKWMINLVKKSKLIWFSVYCIIAGLLTILFA
ncbi:MAG: undecaprenyl-diphosphate phosphatase [Bacteroidales bacterium]